MERKVKVLVAVAWALSIVCSLYAGYALAPWLQARHGVSRVEANVFVFKETTHGVELILGGNVITDIGEEYAGSNDTSLIKYISIGNATASASLTKLTSEYDRKEGTVVEWTYNGDYAKNITYKWTSLSVTLNAAGIHWSGTANSDNNLYAVANFDQTTFNNENLTIRWMLVWDCN